MPIVKVSDLEPGHVFESLNKPGKKRVVTEVLGHCYSPDFYELRVRPLGAEATTSVTFERDAEVDYFGRAVEYERP